MGCLPWEVGDTESKRFLVIGVLKLVNKEMKETGTSQLGYELQAPDEFWLLGSQKYRPLDIICLLTEVCTVVRKEFLPQPDLVIW